MRPTHQVDSVALPPKLPLVVRTSNRDSTYHKDARLVNCYTETTPEGEVCVRKRAGLGSPTQVATAGSAGRGNFYWRGSEYSIYAGTLFKDGVSVGSGLDQTNGSYRFNSILGATPKLVFGNGAKTYCYSGSGAISSDLHTLDVDFPATCVKGIEYLNGALYVMNAAGEIWNSAVNSVDTGTSWGALNFIAAQMEADAGVALAKQKTYLVALGEWSTEVFYDAGNPTGSPLAAVQGQKIAFGCMNADTVQNIDDRLFWVSSTRAAYPQISMMDNLNHEVISTPAIDRLIRNTRGDLMSSFQVKIDGHSFYVVSFVGIVNDFTLAYDIVEKEWSQWTDHQGLHFPIVSCAFDASFNLIVQHESNGREYFMLGEFYADDNLPITVEIYTPIFDAGTMRRKNMKVMKFDGDKTSGSVLQIRKSDDDYENWSNFRKVPLYSKYPTLPDGGTFVKRAYHFRHRCNTPFRMKAVDVQYDLGTL